MAEPFTINIDFDRISRALQTRTADLQRQIDKVKGGSRGETGGLLGQDSQSWIFENYNSLAAIIDERVKATKAFETTKG